MKNGAVLCSVVQYGTVQCSAVWYKYNHSILSWEATAGPKLWNIVVSYYIVLICTVLPCTVLPCTVLPCTVLPCTVCTAMYCMYCHALYVLPCTICTEMQCTDLHCTVLYGVGVSGTPHVVGEVQTQNSDTGSTDQTRVRWPKTGVACTVVLFQTSQADWRDYRLTTTLRFPRESESPPAWEGISPG